MSLLRLFKDLSLLTLTPYLLPILLKESPDFTLYVLVLDDELELLLDEAFDDEEELLDAALPPTFNLSPGKINVEDRLLRFIRLDSDKLCFAAILPKVSPDLTVYVFDEEDDLVDDVLVDLELDFELDDLVVLMTRFG